ncbi:MAG: DNA replication and repair protein RecF [Proteobacteria bacterium]|nr:DNA replication and repair protein RecF [Pseudomonadota bacterium]
MARVRTRDGEVTIGTGKDDSGEGEKRAIHIEGEKIRGQAMLAEHLSVCYLTPQMDQVFSSGTQARRQLIDRLTTLFIPDHVRHLSIYEQAKSERKRVLFLHRPDEEWLHVLETRMSEQAVAIAAARLETLALLQQAIDHAESAFPKALLSIKGEVEQDLENGLPALEAEARAQKLWALSRSLDRQSGRTSVGVHRSEFLVHHKTHGMEAEFCSTGEQKALLISVVLASARAKALWSGVVPILLLDEVAAHLDEHRRTSLFEELSVLGTQCWMTGTDSHLFAPFLSVAEVISLPQNTR